MQVTFSQVTHVPELRDTQCLPSSAELQVVLKEHAYSKQIVHPLTGTSNRYIAGDRFHDGPNRIGHKKPTCQFHNMKWCPELNAYQSVTSEVINSKIKSTRLQSSCQQNIYHYFFYNRLMDYWHNVRIINKQRAQMQAQAKPGEVIIRDSLHRFVYTHLPQPRAPEDCHVATCS